MKKYEWRKQEKEIYLPKNRPSIITTPEYQFITIKGEGNPNNPNFGEYISVLYSLSYAIKMTLKNLPSPPKGYIDYTVYPLEGVWDINEEAKKRFNGKLNKDDLIFTLMIRQPNFISKDFFLEQLDLVKKKKYHPLLEQVKFEKIKGGQCVQMLHIGSYDNEPESFKIMEEFAASENVKRVSKTHREIYLSDFRKVPEEKLKTILRFNIETNS
ncbi:MAG: GyrI-like domain-containing protein [Flavobacteriales bacterium]|jgi:hypothetical protein|nr:GyrI-like domain-containing protein [Flavobacteriales bacterium]